jgi:hypothetical protein
MPHVIASVGWSSYGAVMKNLQLLGRTLVLLALAVFACSCTVIEVEPLPEGVADVAIVRNDKVQVTDFVPVLRSALEERGIRTRMVDQAAAAADSVTATYTARRTWDLVPFLSTADVWFRRGGVQIGHVHYHLAGKGGLDLSKFEGTEAKMTPAYDQLLKAYQKAGTPDQD